MELEQETVIERRVINIGGENYLIETKTVTTREFVDDILVQEWSRTRIIMVVNLSPFI